MILLFAALPAGGASQVLSPTIDDLLAVREFGDIRVSPDGGRVAFVVRFADRADNAFHSRIHLANLAVNEIRPLTAKGTDARSPRWSPRGDYLAFIARAAEAEKADGGNGGEAQVYLLPTQGGASRVLTDAAEGVRDFAWLPDGGALVYLAREPLPEAVAAWRAARRERGDDARVVHGDRRPLSLWRVPVGAGDIERVYRGGAGVRSFALAPDGQSAVLTANRTGLTDDPTNLWIVDLAEGTATRLTNRDGSESDAAFSPDGESVLFRASVDPAIDYSQTDLFRIPLDGGPPRNLTSEFDRGVGEFTWYAGANRIVFSTSFGTATHLHSLDPADGSIRRVLGGARVVDEFTVAPGGFEIFAVVATPESLPELHRLDGDGDLRRISALNQRLMERIAWNRSDVVSWTAEDGFEIEGVVTYPANYDDERRYPLVLEIHGGPHGRTTRALPGSDFAQLWAARDYVVLQPNYRGSAGYGNAFGLANRHDLGGGDYRDIMAGVDALIERGVVDSTRMGVSGGSYGGYMTNWIIGQTDRFAAAISLYGIFSLRTDFSNSNIPSWEPKYLGAYYWEDPRLYRERSPMSYVADMTTPVLIMHGAADPNTRPTNSREMYQALRLLGRDVEFVLYPREGHGISEEPAHIVDKWSRMRLWFDARVRFRGRPDAMVYAMGDSVPARTGGVAEGWALRVTGARLAGSFSGTAERFLEIDLLLSRTETARPLELTLAGDSADLRLVREDFAAIVPVGFVLTGTGAATVAAGRTRIHLAATAAAPRAAAFTAAFPAPAPGDWRLEMAGFGPVNIRVPVDGVTTTALR